MRRALRLAGNLLIAISLLGALTLIIALVVPEAEPQITSAAPVGFSQTVWSGVLAKLSGAGAWSPRRADSPIGTTQSSTPSAQTIADEPARPITHLEIPSIELSADVVPADLVAVDGGYTWQVPAFSVGHAETTAGAGQPGNAVLLGHVTSLHSGNVFQDLDRVHTGDTVQVFSDADEFVYQVVSTSRVPRSDSSVLQPTSATGVTLITCTGMWLPTIWDYTERLVVYAELAQ
jgi:LPXTG-site transpeptidase (sortase) family protein